VGGTAVGVEVGVAPQADRVAAATAIAEAFKNIRRSTGDLPDIGLSSFCTCKSSFCGSCQTG
jgi:hypothetical protein